jgi:hypothetical protein
VVGEGDHIQTAPLRLLQNIEIIGAAASAVAALAGLAAVRVRRTGAALGRAAVTFFSAVSAFCLLRGLLSARIVFVGMES